MIRHILLSSLASGLALSIANRGFMISENVRSVWFFFNRCGHQADATMRPTVEEMDNQADWE